MTDSLFSPSWYRVSGLRPRLRGHARIHRHRYRGQLSYVLQDLSSERFHRFSPAAYLVIGLMDGERTVQEIWDVATERLGDEAPSQDETIQLLGQLHAADVLQCDVPPDTAELLRRHEGAHQRAWRSRVTSVLSWKVALLDPERMLERALPVVRPLIGWAGALVWLAVVLPAAVLAATHWNDLTRDALDRLLTVQNMAVLWLVFPLVKALHELGHALATKAFGGEVHDMGVMLLVLTPVPYVDASSAWAFRATWQRVLTGAAGMLVELFVGALAFYVWLGAEPGVVRSIAYNVVVIAGVSTVLFNANPLLRFDGYYILSDVLEIPNLRSRASAYLGYLCERYLFGRADAELAPATPGERTWLVLYAVASVLYRALVGLGIALFVASRFFAVGVVLAIVGIAAWTVVPLARGLAALNGPRLRPVRRRALTVSAFGAAAVVGSTCLVPLPLRTQTEGVVWVPDEAVVRAGTDAFVARIAAPPGSRVRRGDVLIECRDPDVVAREQALAAHLQEIEARVDEYLLTDRVKVEVMREEMRVVQQEVARARERVADLIIRSQAEGTFLVPEPDDLPDRFVKRGERLGYVVDAPAITVRAVVAQENTELVRHRTRGVDIRLAERVPVVLPTVVQREIPGASEQLPSPALGSMGGGRVAVDPTDPHGTKAVQSVFQVELALPREVRGVNVGGRVYVRFDHGWEPLAAQAYRRVRQVFLGRFNV